MPELPEVETVRAGLENHLVSRRISSVDIFHSRVIRHLAKGGFVTGTQSPVQATRFYREALVGRTIESVARRGKYLWLELGEDLGLVIHLGMSGQLLVDSPVPDTSSREAEADFLGESTVDLTAATVLRSGVADNRHRRAQLELDGGVAIRFIDQRTFGHFTLSTMVGTGDGQVGGHAAIRPAIPVVMAHIARDILDPFLDEDELIANLRTRRRAVKTVLLDQQLVSGVGSIYADEGCFLSGVKPTWSARAISYRGWQEILANTREVMRQALRVGGTSFDALYVDVDGAPGFFARQLQVYGRAGKPCRQCGVQLHKTVVDGRSAVYCPGCQKRRKVR